MQVNFVSFLLLFLFDIFFKILFAICTKENVFLPLAIDENERENIRTKHKHTYTHIHILSMCQQPRLCVAGERVNYLTTLENLTGKNLQPFPGKVDNGAH